MTEEESILWQRIREGDEKAFEQYYKEQHEAFYMMACQYTHDPSSAREVVNDVFMNIWEKAGSLQIEVSLKAYIYKAVINRCLNVLQRRKKDASQMKEIQSHLPLSEEQRLMEDNELELLLYKAIDELPEQCRNVFRMSRFQQMKQQAIAETLGISVKAVKYHITRALKQLYRVIEGRDLIGLVVVHVSIFYMSPGPSPFFIV